MLAADRYTPVDEGLIPTGVLDPVEGTPMDFTSPMAIGARIAQVEGGYDHNYVLTGGGGTLALAARVYEPESGRIMEISTDQPGIQFYTGKLPGRDHHRQRRPRLQANIGASAWRLSISPILPTSRISPARSCDPGQVYRTTDGPQVFGEIA